MTNPDDSIQDLARIITAAVRLMAHMHRLGAVSDLDDDVTHMRANLDHLAQQIAGAKS